MDCPEFLVSSILDRSPSGINIFPFTSGVLVVEVRLGASRVRKGHRVLEQSSGKNFLPAVRDKCIAYLSSKTYLTMISV